MLWLPLRSPSAPSNEDKWDEFVLWKFLEPVLRKALLQYKRDESKPAVLIFDNVNQYAKENQQLLAVLQLFAKECADQRLARIIFVGSESLALPIFQKTSAYSRSDFFTSKYLDITHQGCFVNKYTLICETPKFVMHQNGSYVGVVPEFFCIFFSLNNNSWI